MKKGAIFDQDGLMFDTEAIFARAWAEAAERLGAVIPEGFHAAVCGSGEEVAKRIIRDWIPGVDCDRFLELVYRISYDIQSRTLPEKPGLHEILEFFRSRGVKLAVASSSHRAPVERNLEKSGVRPYFEAIVSGEELSRGKPDPEAFLTAAELSAFPRRTAMFLRTASTASGPGTRRAVVPL